MKATEPDHPRSSCLRVFACLVLASLSLASRLSADIISELNVVQTDYALEDVDSKIRITWLESNPDSIPIDVLLNDGVFATVPGGAGKKEVTLVVTNFGFTVVQLRSGVFQVGEVVQNVVDDQPMGDAIEMSVGCEGGAAGEECEITVVFTNPGPPADEFKVAVNGQEVAKVDGGIQAGTELHVPASGDGERCVTMESTLKTENGSYASDVTKACCDLKCKPKVLNRFVRGVCDGSSAAPDIGTVIFSLRHLFQGRGSPPCNEACDANADSRIDLTDMVYTLQYLFRGGSAPVGWNDRDGDGRKDPTCESAGESSCGTPHESCAP